MSEEFISMYINKFPKTLYEKLREKENVNKKGDLTKAIVKAVKSFVN